MVKDDAPEQDPESCGFTPERLRNFVPKQGFAYYIVILRVTPGLRFGLGIKHYRNMVIVSKVEEGTLSADALQVADRIIDVNGAPVSDKGVAKTLILRSLQTEGSVNMVIERAEDPAAKAIVQGYLNASKYQPPSVAMASDVKSIVHRYFEKLKMGHGNAKPVPALRSADAPRRDHGRVHFDEEASHQSILIGVDNKSKAAPTRNAFSEFSIGPERDIEKMDQGNFIEKVPQKKPPPSLDSASLE